MRLFLSFLRKNSNRVYSKNLQILHLLIIKVDAGYIRLFVLEQSFFFLKIHPKIQRQSLLNKNKGGGILQMACFFSWENSWRTLKKKNVSKTLQYINLRGLLIFPAYLCSFMVIWEGHVEPKYFCLRFVCDSSNILF